jgi:HPP family
MENIPVESSVVRVLSDHSSAKFMDREEQLKQYEEKLRQQQQQIDSLIEELDQIKYIAPNTRTKWKFPRILPNLQNYLSGIYGSSTYQPRFSAKQILFSYVGSFIGIGALAYFSIGSGYPLIAAPFGAAAVLLFAVPSSPLAQPRNLIFGNLLGGFVSLVMVHLFGSEPWVMALSVATAIKLMQLTKTLHPPGGAVALVGVMSEAQWDFIFTPVLAGSIILLFCTLAFNNLMPGRSYPHHWL